MGVRHSTALFLLMNDTSTDDTLAVNSVCQHWNLNTVWTRRLNHPDKLARASFQGRGSLSLPWTLAIVSLGPFPFSEGQTCCDVTMILDLQICHTLSSCLCLTSSNIIIRLASLCLELIGEAFGSSEAVLLVLWTTFVKFNPPYPSSNFMSFQRTLCWCRSVQWSHSLSIKDGQAGNTPCMFVWLCRYFPQSG